MNAKKIVAIILVLAMSLCLFGCKAKTPEDATAGLCKELQAGNIKGIISYVAKECDMSELKDAYDELDKDYIKLFKKFTKEIKYSVGEAEIDAETAIVPVDFSVINLAPILSKVTAGTLLEGINAYLKGDTSDLKDYFIDQVEKGLKSENLEYLDFTLPIPCKKEKDGWKVVSSGREILYIFFGDELADLQNMLSY